MFAEVYARGCALFMCGGLVALFGAPADAVAQTTTSGDVVLLARDAAHIQGNWKLIDDPGAAGGVRIWNPNAGVAKLPGALASPSSFFELTFNAEANRGYRLWIRGRAEKDAWTNDSAYVQFSGSVSSTGTPVNRIGSTSATWVGVEDGSGCGLQGWGWQDNGYGTGVLGPLVYFAQSGPQTIRIQQREDGLSIDQIVLSAGSYLTVAPGATKNDVTLLDSTLDAAAPAPQTGPVVLRVLQWNLHHGVGTDGRYDLERIAGWMAAMKPDIVLLNEVEVHQLGE